MSVKPPYLMLAFAAAAVLIGTAPAAATTELRVNCLSDIIRSERRQLWKARRFGGKGRPPAGQEKAHGGVHKLH